MYQNMVCNRYKMVVLHLFTQIHMVLIGIDLNEIEISEALTEAQDNKFQINLVRVGFGLLDDQRGYIIRGYVI